MPKSMSSSRIPGLWNQRVFYTAGVSKREDILQIANVVTAADASQALEFFKTAHFALVITDHLLEQTTATAIRSLNPYPWPPIDDSDAARFGEVQCSSRTALRA